MPKLKKKQQAKSAIDKNIKMLKELLPSASSVRENVEAQEHINHLVTLGRTLEGIRESDPYMARILTEIDNEIEQIERSSLVKNAAPNAPAEAAPDEAQPIRAKAAPAKPIASVEGRRKLINLAKQLTDDFQAMSRALAKEATQGSVVEEPAKQVIKGTAPQAQQGVLVKPIAPPAEPGIDARKGLKDAARKANEATAKLREAVRTAGAKEAIQGAIKQEPAKQAIEGTAAQAPQDAGLLRKPTVSPAEPSDNRQGLKDAVKRVNKATAALKSAVNQKIATTESIKPNVVGHVLQPQPQKAVRGQIQPPETIVPQPQKAKIIPPPAAIKIPDAQPTQFRPARAKAKPAPVVKPAPAAKPAAAVAAPEDAFTALRRELNKSEPNAVTIRNILNGFGNLDNTNLDLLERDPNLINSLAALKNAITIGADNRVTLHEKFTAKVNDARIHLEQDLMQPIRDTVASLQNDSAPRDLQVQINRALDYSTGLPLYSDLRRPLEELRNKIQESDAINAETVKNDFDKTVTTHMVGRLRNLLARSQEPDNAELEYVLKQLSAPITGLANTHSLLQETALPNTLHQLERVKNAGTDLERSAAKAALTLAIKNLRFVVTEPEHLNRKTALEQQIRGMDPNDKARIIANVGNHLDRYTNIALFSNQAQMSRRAKSRDESLPVMEQKLEDIKLHLEVYRQDFAAKSREHGRKQPITESDHQQLIALRRAAQESDGATLAAMNNLLGNDGIAKNHHIYKILQPIRAELGDNPSPAALAAFRVRVNGALGEIDMLQRDYLMEKLKMTLAGMHNENLFTGGPEAVNRVNSINKNYLDPLLTNPQSLALFSPEQQEALQRLKREMNPTPSEEAIFAAINALPVRERKPIEQQMQIWHDEQNAMQQQQNKINASIESLDKILEQGDRAYVKPMKLKILADRNEVVSKDTLQATIDRFNGNMPVIAPPPRMEQGGAGKSRAFSSSEALVTTTSITTGFGPTKKASEFMSVISNENGVHTAQLYFHEKEMKSSLFGGKDGYTKGGAKTMHDFLATSPAPYKPIHITAGAPKEFVKEILTYCKLKNIKISVDASYKMSLSDVSKSDVKSLQDRLTKLFPDDPNMAVDVNKEAVVQQQMSTGIRAKK